MGSVGFDVEDEFPPCTSNGKKYNVPRTVPAGGRAVNHSSVPRKLRSAIKKRGRKSGPPQLTISRKQYHMPNRFEKLRKDGVKKSKPSRKQGHITKDEEEVAETLYALAGMFSDANRANQTGPHTEPLETKTSATQEAGSSMNAAEDRGIQTQQEESREIASNFTREVVRHSSDLVDSTGKVVRFQSFGDVQQPELPPTSKLPAAPSASGNQYECLDSRLRVSTLSPIPSSEQAAVAIKQVAASGTLYDKNTSSMDEKNSGSFLPPILSTRGGVNSETPVSCLRFPKSTNSVSQPFFTENRVTSEKYAQALAPVESKKLWERCSAHVYISRLIKVLQVSEGKESLLEKPTQITCGIVGPPTHVSTHSQMTWTNGRNSCVSFNDVTHSSAPSESAEIQTDITKHKRLRQDQQLTSEPSASCSSTYQGYDFLSLGTGVLGMDANRNVNRTEQEAPEQFHAPNVHSQSQAAMLFSLPQNGYSSTYHGHSSVLAAQQVHLPQYPSRAINARMGQQSDLHQQKWVAEISTHYNTGAITTPQLPAGWKNGGCNTHPMLSYTHAVFPHLQAAMGSKFQQFSPTQQQLIAMNSSPLPLSNVKRHQLQLPLGFERNGPSFYQDSMQQLQLPCNQHLSN